jgi:putative endonuclease|tara:strand:+ start:135 stop:398 length:264 start_codon:yes stop_codon:yes gene_type:complete
MKNWWVYIIECRNKSLYTGITTDVERRFNEHQNNNKKASKYCASLRPLKLIYKSLPFENKSDASKEEYRIKQLSHKDKLYFIKNINE